MTSVAVADVVPLVRLGLATVLRAEGVEVVVEVATGRDLAKAVIEHAPDLVVVGALNDLPPDELARQVRAAGAGTRIMVLLGRIPRESLADVLAIDVDGLVSRAVDGDGLRLALGRVLAGERYIDPLLISGDLPDEDFEPTALTAREREVLGLLASGCSNREIASSLFVSLPTVKTHLAHIYEKLDARNRNEALGRAMALGLLA